MRNFYLSPSFAPYLPFRLQSFPPIYLVELPSFKAAHKCLVAGLCEANTASAVCVYLLLPQIPPRSKLGPQFRLSGWFSLVTGT